MTAVHYSAVRADEPSDLRILAQHMFTLMLRNIASDGYTFPDPLTPGRFSAPGCVIASPSYPSDLGTVNQDYVFNWVRDAALTALELVAATLPSPQPLIDYTLFCQACQNSDPPTLGHGCYTIEATPREWSEQSDGPALQVIALLGAYAGLDPATQATARAVIAADLAYLLGSEPGSPVAYQQPTTNLWEEVTGASFFARSVQLRCLQAVAANTVGVPVPDQTAEAIAWLQTALESHWDGTRYVSVLPAPNDGYDPNIDIVMAAIYGAVPITDTRMLATAAQLRGQWADSGSPAFFPINGDDDQRGLGPVLGRYPGDTYDGDTTDPAVRGHPWPLCTCSLAELYHRLAAAIGAGTAVPFDALSSPFFAPVGVTAQTTAADAQTALAAAGDRMLRAVVFHSDHLELSEQFDATTGFEKSVRNLTWSYAAFLSAVRARGGGTVEG
jgi:glucoamylase